MFEVDQLLEMAREILRNRYATLEDYAIDTLARQAVAKPIDTSLNGSQIKRELSKRITQLVSSQFPNHRPRRFGRGALVTIGDKQPRDRSAELDPESQKDLTDQILSKKALDSSESPHSRAVQREKEKNADKVQEVREQTSSTNSAALEKLLEAVGVGDSLGQLGREPAAREVIHRFFAPKQSSVS